MEISLVSLLPMAGTVGIVLARSVGGWMVNALEDGKISKFELKKLGATIIEMSLITACLYYGVSELAGVEIGVVAAGASAFVLDFIVKKFSSSRKK